MLIISCVKKCKSTGRRGVFKKKKIQHLLSVNAIPEFSVISYLEKRKMITDISQLDRKATYTYADYLSWQLNEMVELIKGKLYILSPAPAERHQRLVTNLTIEIGSWFKGKDSSLYVAPFDVRLIKSEAADAEVLLLWNRIFV
jgi:Putative restriction endonuclease